MGSYNPEDYLRRYTELPYLIDYLRTKELVMPNPDTWDDKNDTFYIRRYSEINKLSATYALCLTQAEETYHHWRVFSHGSGGVCIEFNKDAFLKKLSTLDSIRHASVVYKRIKELRSSPPSENDLPFLKRVAFQDEKEYRLFVGSEQSLGPVYRFTLPFSVISRIILSPWLPKPVAEQVKLLLKEISDCKTLKIYRSTLVENEDWKMLANRSNKDA